MKLFTKYNRINLASTIIIFLLASLAFSFLLKYVITSQLDEDLRIEKNEILSYVEKNNALPQIVEVHDQYTQYRLVNRIPKEFELIITERLPLGKHKRKVHSIVFYTTINNNIYKIIVSIPLEDADELISSIIIISLSTIVLILMATFVINQLTLRRLWQPFYQTLETVNNFKISKDTLQKFEVNKIDEFNLLNQTLSSVIGKAQQDYQVLKEFTENASHELQTPLAIIQSKLDLIIQSEALTESQSKAALSAYEAIRRMKRLNESLLLLAKIENDQYSFFEKINLRPLLIEKIFQFKDQCDTKKIMVEEKLDDVWIEGNSQLIDILINNLLSNAIRHNREFGLISVNVKKGLLQISNSGEATGLHEASIFTRFYKGQSSTGQHGLGLSIVKQICIASRYTCTYQFSTPDIHSFAIGWHVE